MKALDPSAPGPIPYTIVVAPGGKILYRHAGELDSADFLSRIIDILGPYYPPTGR